jgi:predicted DNA-binding transcriptional regulator AlpA
MPQYAMHRIIVPEAVIASLSRTEGKTTENPPVFTNAATTGLVKPQKPLTGGDGFDRIETMTKPKLSATGKLVMLHEMAKLFGVSKHTAWTYITNEALKFPPPEDTLKAGAVWRRADVEKWGTKNLPLPVGRPPKKCR